MLVNLQHQRSDLDCFFIMQHFIVALYHGQEKYLFHTDCQIYKEISKLYISFCVSKLEHYNNKLWPVKGLYVGLK